MLQDELQKWRRRTIHRHYHCIPQAISVFVLFCLVFVLLCFVYVHSRNHEPFIEPKRLHTFEQARRSGIPITEEGRCGILRFVTHRRASLPIRVLRRGEKWSTDGRTFVRVSAKRVADWLQLACIIIERGSVLMTRCL